MWRWDWKPDGESNFGLQPEETGQRSRVQLWGTGLKTRVLDKFLLVEIEVEAGESSWTVVTGPQGRLGALHWAARAHGGRCRAGVHCQSRAGLGRSPLWRSPVLSRSELLFIGHWLYYVDRLMGIWGREQTLMCRNSQESQEEEELGCRLKREQSQVRCVRMHFFILEK